jgi:SAM-dependent methyltransferase
MNKTKATAEQTPPSKGPEKQGPFDTALIRQRRRRGAYMSGEAFLSHRCAEDLSERLLDINRTFDKVLVIADDDFYDTLCAHTLGKFGHVVQANLNPSPHNATIIDLEKPLPFTAKSFDLVISGLVLHGVNRADQAILDTRRVLTDDGLFIGCLLGGDTLNELRTALYETEERLTGHVTPRISPMIRLNQAASLLQKSGFAMPVVDRDLVKVHYRNMANLIADLRKMGATNALTQRNKKLLPRPFFKILENGLRTQTSGLEGRFQISFDVLWLCGWAPHPDQQKPLKPGSAHMRLADALGVKEEKLS